MGAAVSYCGHDDTAGGEITGEVLWAGLGPEASKVLPDLPKLIPLSLTDQM